ncbi:MAG: RnfABCDGE type electron transport complex subunit D, partial [Halioglobus sp.]|nr:RnfABCDGE type electron transport complex subunit D [Halioglobus sp.]
RAFLQAAFPAAMTSWQPPMLAQRFTELPASTLTLPFARPEYDGVSAATPLAQMKFEQAATPAGDLLLGMTAGSTGETGALLILLGGAWLVARNMMNWRIPAAIFATVAGLAALLGWIAPGQYPGPLFMLLSGGLMLGAVFMATDMVASPITARGVVLYGVLIGTLVVVIRLWGGMPEGVMYAILIANAVSPHIDRLVQPRAFGTTGRGVR